MIGRVLGDNYEIEGLIGVGGMGRVYRATQRALSRTVAIKVIHPTLLGDEATVARFYTEARAASRLNHPNSVSIFDFGRTDDGMLYLVMEHLRGRDLSLVMREEAPLGLARVVELACGVLAGLFEAHALGVVHCDLKPENIIVESLRSGGDLVKVVDFGLAKLRGAEPVGSQERGLVSGTPDYMSPEQARAQDVDARGDLYSFGVVLFEMLTGRLPFYGRDASEVMTAHVRTPASDPTVVAPDRHIPEAMAKVVMRALAKSPDKRYQNAHLMAAALRASLPRRLSLPTVDILVCAECGGRSTMDHKYCGECGASLSKSSCPPSASRGFLSSRPSRRVSSLLGRSSEIALLDGLRRDLEEAPASAYVYGRVGIGKTTVLEELASLAERDGDLVLHAESHPTGVPMSYGPIRQLMAQALRSESFEALTDDQVPAENPLERAGMQELREPRGMLGLSGESCHEAVAALLVRTLRHAISGTPDRRIVLLVDDLDLADGLSTNVLATLPDLVRGCRLLCVAAGQRDSGLEDTWPGVAVGLRGLDSSMARHFTGAGEIPALEEGGFLPLLAVQLAALNWEARSAEEPVPCLADAVERRVDALDVVARRLLQVICVLGNGASLSRVRALLGADDLAGLDVLRETGFLSYQGDWVRIAHPFVRELVHLSIPVERRWALNRLALERVAAAREPQEIWVEHACGSGEIKVGLILLERVGADAFKCGDLRLAVRSFQRALELARRELLESGDPVFESAVASFSLRLATAMFKQGLSARAAGVVREALDLTSVNPDLRCRMLCLLAETAAQRAKPVLAAKWHAEARALVGKQNVPFELDVRLLCTQARLRALARDPVGQERALSAAWKRVEAGSRPDDLRLGLELTTLRFSLGDLREAREVCDRLLVVAPKLPALRARVLGVLAEVEAMEGRADLARARYEGAAEQAALGGDGASCARFRAAAEAMGAS